MRSGESLELRVYSALKELLARGELGLDPRHWKAFRQKGYYSNERAKDIKVDVSLEFLPPGNMGSPVIVWIWECKDYSGPISVGELQKFNSDLEQIGAANTKGTVITDRGTYQPSALKYAEFKKIALARLVEGRSIQYVSSSHCLVVLVFVGLSLTTLAKKWWPYVAAVVIGFVVIDMIFTKWLNSTDPPRPAQPADPPRPAQPADPVQTLCDPQFTSRNGGVYALSAAGPYARDLTEFIRAELAHLLLDRKQ